MGGAAWIRGGGTEHCPRRISVENYRPGGGTGELAAFLARLEKPDRSTSWIRRLRSWTMFDRDAHSSDPRQPSATAEKLRDHVVSMQKAW
ncbi:hypothetical protein WMF38_30645 [Sorangium sp. So ce118]